jgi:S-adenosylmethionine synthetase
MELTNEIVFRGHPDKVCDQIAGACVDDILAHDPEAHTGIECAVKDSRLWMFGEVRSTYKCPYKKIAKRVLRDIGYWQRFKVRVNISRQSPDIAMGVRRHGAGRQRDDVRLRHGRDARAVAKSAGNPTAHRGEV